MPVLAEHHVIDFRQIHWLRGKIPLTCCWEQKAAFLSVGSINVVVLLPLREIDNYFGRKFSWSVLSRGKCTPELSEKHSCWIHLLEIALQSLIARRRHAKKVGNFHFLCLVQVMIIYIAVEETILAFVLASTHAARCKEEAASLDLYKHVHTCHCKHLRNFMLLSFYCKTVREKNLIAEKSLWFSNKLAKFAPSCRKMAMH